MGAEFKTDTGDQALRKWVSLAGGVRFDSRPFIEGDWCAPRTVASFRTSNPATNTYLAEFVDCACPEIDAAVGASRRAFRDVWRGRAPERRKLDLTRVAASMREAREDLALFDCLEMGMPISMALEQVDAAVTFLLYYAELADKIFGEVAPTDTRHSLAMTYREPRGVVGIISPWNYPLITAISAIAPALAAGNCVVVKPSEQAPSSVLRLAMLAQQAGLPPGVLNVVPGRGASAGAALSRHMDVDMVHFTGSTIVGRKLAGEALGSNGKPVMLEAGGKSPQIVFADVAGLDGLGVALAQAAFANSGQLCVARTRLLVHESALDDVLDAVRIGVRATFVAGNPLDPRVNFGPLANQKQYENVCRYLDIGRGEGARQETLTIGGNLPAQGFFLAPVLFTAARKEMRIARDEIFGPVMTTFGFRTEEEAVDLANDVGYGLAATTWTADLGRARRMSHELMAGRVEIRTHAAPGAPVEAFSAEPFGSSGHGVLGGVRGLDPYLRLKGVQIITG